MENNNQELNKVNDKKILNNKLFLYLTEFFAGMSLMAIEIGAQRLLAPYFSSSQIVWTIVIGTIMIAMALGNIYGGRKADKDPNPNHLYARLIIAGTWIALIPWLGKYVIAGLSAILIFAVNAGYLIVASVASCIVLFIFPLFLLGTTTPSLAKYITKSIADSGKIVGYLNAYNTIGSIIGTFLPTFVTIPTIGTNLTFLIFASILLALAFIYFISCKVFQVKMVVAIIALILGAIFGYKSNFAFWRNDLKFEGESTYNYLQVYEDEYEVSLSTNVLFGVQSVYFKSDDLRRTYYYDCDLIVPLMADYYLDEKADILILGMGSGTYATRLKHFFPNANITGVEIDEKITKLAYDYFYLDENIKVYTYDGRAFLNATSDKYDIIMVDAYQDITIPFQMSSIEFFILVKDHLKDNGVLVTNLNMRSDEEGNINQYLCDTIANVFSINYYYNVPYSTNRELYSSNNPQLMAFLNDNLFFVKDEKLKLFLKDVSDNLVYYEKTNYLFTDDKAPVELLGIAVIDKEINKSVEYYREIYKEKGIKGLLEYLD